MILNAELIRESEENAVKSGAFSLKELMLNAGRAAAEIIMQKYSILNKRITVLCGNGNNGGDGFVIAKELSENGAAVSVVTPFGAPKTENAAFYYGKLGAVNVSERLETENCDIVIDALFGIGLNRKLNENAEKLINKVNSLNAVKIAVDIPSGVEADTGRVLGAAFCADLTVTFIALKPCFVLPEGSDYCGEVLVADIGVKPIGSTFSTTQKPKFKKRRHNSHKGTYGTALLFCGSYGYAGAAVLAARAALRSGVGIAKAVLSESIYAPFTAAVPEAVCVPIKQNGTADLNIKALLNKADAVLAGSGSGNNDETEYLVKELFKTAEIPIVIDADGINVIANSIDIIKNTKAPVILTPHPGEMARLLGVTAKEVEADRVSIARGFAKEYGCILVLKGANTIIALPNGEITFNLTGNPGMACGGSGDVLSGITVSLLAQGFSPESAAKYAVYLHGEAGDKAALRRGERAMLPTDIIEEL